MLLAKYRLSSDFNMLQLIVNPYYYAFTLYKLVFKNFEYIFQVVKV
jgi:hypothetical protein